jgi:hypothetical protein
MTTQEQIAWRGFIAGVCVGCVALLVILFLGGAL